MVYLITYDLNKPGQDYSKLYETIKAMGAWWHYLDSTWLVDTSLSSGQVRDGVLKVMDQTDRVLVVRFSSDWSAFLTNDAADWIRQRQGVSVE